MGNPNCKKIKHSYNFTSSPSTIAKSIYYNKIRWKNTELSSKNFNQELFQPIFTGLAAPPGQMGREESVNDYVASIDQKRRVAPVLVDGNYDDILTLPISISQIVASALGRSVENSVISKKEEEINSINIARSKAAMKRQWYHRDSKAIANKIQKQ